MAAGPLVAKRLEAEYRTKYLGAPNMEGPLRMFHAGVLRAAKARYRAPSKKARSCSRCGGTGFCPQYAHNGGQCYACH